MSILNELAELFPKEIALRPSGFYAHIITLRLTESYPVFRTDEGLNTARVAVGRQWPELIDRVTIFMRKQTTPERLRGRELLRKYDKGQEMQKCTYNEHDAKKKIGPCGQCPDCVTYGFAIGDSGAEKAKVFGDTAYSLTGHDVSHTLRTFNAPNESGVMYDAESKQTSNRINATEYALPGLIFPSVTTLRDLPFEFFEYILNNILSTKRYGAITTRTGRVENHVVGIAIADGEIMSNLALTQALYDALEKEDLWPQDDLVTMDAVYQVLPRILEQLLAESRVQVADFLIRDELSEFLRDFDQEFTQKLDEQIPQLFALARDYRESLTGRSK